MPSGTVVLRGARNESWIVVAACLRSVRLAIAIAAHRSGVLINSAVIISANDSAKRRALLNLRKTALNFRKTALNLRRNGAESPQNGRTGKYGPYVFVNTGNLGLYFAVRICSEKQ